MLFSITFVDGENSMKQRVAPLRIVCWTMSAWAWLSCVTAGWSETISISSYTRIDSYSADQAYGAGQTLKLIINSANKNAGSCVRILMDLPDSSELPSISWAISSAKLWVFLNYISPASGETFSSRGVAAYPLTAAFDASTATFNSLGSAYDSTAAKSTMTASASVDADTNLGWYYFDLTGLYQSGRDLSGGVIMMLDPETCPVKSSTYCTYVISSSKTGDGNTPYLEIATVPEPSAIVMLLGGLRVLSVRIKRRRE